MDRPMPSSLVEILETLEDPRVDRTQLHPLTDILVLSVLAVICGADSFVAIALFGQFQEEWLRTFLELPNGIPSHDTLGRVFARLDASGFEEGFRDWVQEAFERTDGQSARLPRPGPGALTREFAQRCHDWWGLCEGMAGPVHWEYLPLPRPRRVAMLRTPALYPLCRELRRHLPSIQGRLR